MLKFSSVPRQQIQDYQGPLTHLTQPARNESKVCEDRGSRAEDSPRRRTFQHVTRCYKLFGVKIDHVNINIVFSC